MDSTVRCSPKSSRLPTACAACWGSSAHIDGELVPSLRSWRFTATLVAIVAMWIATPRAEPVTVRYAEGLVHGFLTLKSPDGALLASGDLIQRASGTRVTTQLVFHFKDGSTSNETAVFSQRGQFALITDHVIQKGPAFARPLEMTIDRPNGHVVVRYNDEDGKPKVEDERMNLPA